MTIDPNTKDIIITVSLYAIVLASGVSGLMQLLGGWRDRAAADKRHLREQAIKLALEQWHYESKRANGVSISAIGPEGQTLIRDERKISPARDLHEVVFRALKFADAFSKKTVTESNLRDFLSKPDTERNENG